MATASGVQDPAVAAIPRGGSGGAFKGSSGSLGPLFGVLVVIMVLAVLSCIFSHFVVKQSAASSIPWHIRLCQLQWWGCNRTYTPCKAMARVANVICGGIGASDANQQKLPLQLPSSVPAAAAGAP